MSRVTDKWKIDLFLAQFKKHWLPQCYVVPRDVNNTSLTELGLTPIQRQQEILNLTYQNYMDGPIPDHDHSGEFLWVFATRIDDAEVYIKLKTFETGGKTRSICLSFHRAKAALSYPYR